MKRVLSVKESRRLDEIAVENGCSIRSLIASSGKKMAEHILTSDYAGKSILFVCGKGHNGADQIAAADSLYTVYKGDIAIFVPRSVRGDLSAETARLFENTPVCITEEIGDFDVYFDGLLGTGFSDEVDGEFREIILTLNKKREQGAYVVATDIPSGINGDSGKVCGVGVIADETLALAALKPGFYLNDAPDHCGKITLLDIGIGSDIYAQVGTFARVADSAFIKSILPKRKISSYKGSSGYLHVLAGSFGMSGAAIIAAKSAYLAGAGLVKIVGEKELISSINSGFFDAIFDVLETNDRVFSTNHNQILLSIHGYKCSLIGPGLKICQNDKEAFCCLVEELPLPLVLDASSLTAISEYGAVETLKQRQNATILTPHPGEMSCLMGSSIEECERDRVLTAKTAAERFNSVVVYKGGRAVIADPNGDIYFNPTGNGALAVAGSGDMLSGIIAGLLSGGLRPLDAALAGCYIGGKAAEAFSNVYPQMSSTASELLRFVPSAINSVLVP